MTYHYTAKDPGDLIEVASQIINDAGSTKIFALHGEMGVGKTTLIRALCSTLKVSDHVTSPTFSIVNEYRRGEGNDVYHFDFYRINSIAEVYDLGYENYLFSNHYCFIEWPEKVESLLNMPKATIFITSENNRRNIELRTE